MWLGIKERRRKKRGAVLTSEMRLAEEDRLGYEVGADHWLSEPSGRQILLSPMIVSLLCTPYDYSQDRRLSLDLLIFIHFSTKKSKSYSQKLS
jgi:hypothetical protein